MLGDTSPRAAVRSEQGREKVITWLKYLENMEERRARTPGSGPSISRECGVNSGSWIRGDRPHRRAVAALSHAGIYRMPTLWIAHLKAGYGRSVENITPCLGSLRPPPTTAASTSLASRREDCGIAAGSTSRTSRM
jgi:hypothetical protein